MSGSLSTINFISLELIEGTLLFKYNSGNAPLNVVFGDDVSNGEYHSVLVEVSTSGSILLYLDCTTDDNCSSYEATVPPSVDFSTTAPFYIGGVEPTSRESSYHLTSTTSFVGSISNLLINGELLSLLPDGSSTTLRSRNVVVGYQRVNQCEDQPCMNGAQCVDLWFDYRCECLPGYSGRLCDFLFLANFDSNSYLYVEYAMSVVSLSLQFSTLNEDGILLSTENVSSHPPLCGRHDVLVCLVDNKWSTAHGGTHIRWSKLIFYRSFQYWVTDWRQCK